jgi:transposase
MPLPVREWVCTACGVRHDRDVYAAKVRRAAGLAVAVVRPGPVHSGLTADPTAELAHLFDTVMQP